MRGAGRLLLLGGALGACAHPSSPPSPPAAQPPDVLEAPSGPPVAGARGSLDKEIIRRIIRRHINEVKYCYELELTNIPDLMGRIMVRFTIAASGDVIASVLQFSTMGNERVENCTIQAVRRWQFPKPLGGGIVIVSYPFVLTPEKISLVPGQNGALSVDVVPLHADSLFVHQSTDARAIGSNGLIAVTDAGLLLVDTAWTEQQTQVVLDWGESRLRRPWIGAVITHDHSDRDGGIGALFRRKIPVAALDLTVARLARRGIKGVATLFDARAGTFADPRGFEAFYPGPGHAPDNIVITFPDSETLFGGCLIKSAVATDLGFVGDADLRAWPDAVRRVASKYPYQKIIPGHGPPDEKGVLFQHTVDLLKSAPTKKP